jgi:predicted TIM-barrel fold metal-dependent hydrolase
MPGIIDFHTHAFPDPVAAHAIPALEKEGDVQAYTDGTVSGLLRSMDRAGIEKSVICSIATRVEQFQSILDWSKQIRSNRIIPLPSVHPLDPLLVEHIKTIKEQGFIGIKLHPYYQDFFLGEERMDELYQTLIDCDLLLVVHTGFDIAYPRIRRCDPTQVMKVVDKFPDLKLITTHFGGWDDWQEVRRLLIGKPIYMDLSFSLDYLRREQAKEMLMAHPAEYILFGTDSPWKEQKSCLRKLQGLDLGDDLVDKIIRRNGGKLVQALTMPSLQD